MTSPRPQDINVPEDFQIPGLFPDYPDLARAIGVIVRLIQDGGGDWDYVLTTAALQEFLEAHFSDGEERGKIFDGVYECGDRGYFTRVGEGFRPSEHFKTLFRS